MARNKYGNKKVKWEGKTFDSELELYAWKLLTNFKIDFDWQVRHELQPKFHYNGSNIRAITMIIDFVIRVPGKTIALDTKGFETEVAKIKYKILKYKQSRLPFPDYNEVIWISNKKKVLAFVIELQEYAREKEK